MLEQRVLSLQSGTLGHRRAPLDPCTRKMIYGAIRPMERPGILQRLFGG